MQNTRLNNLFALTSTQLNQFFSNPWRRIALVLLSLLLGFFLGTAITSTAGQTSDWDVIAAAFVVLFTEIISRFVYGRKRNRTAEEVVKSSLLVELVNNLKIGVTYGLFVEAFKLNS
ncbi:MAG: DUF565 domain-containing protein [Spirulinaceae cyanobacterium]